MQCWRIPILRSLWVHLFAFRRVHIVEIYLLFFHIIESGVDPPFWLVLHLVGERFGGSRVLSRCTRGKVPSASWKSCLPSGQNYTQDWKPYLYVLQVYSRSKLYHFKSSVFNADIIHSPDWKMIKIPRIDQTGYYRFSSVCDKIYYKSKKSKSAMGEYFHELRTDPYQIYFAMNSMILSGQPKGLKSFFGRPLILLLCVLCAWNGFSRFTLTQS